MAQPKYLTGDKAGIDAFIDQFDVCTIQESTNGAILTRESQTFLFDCDGTQGFHQYVALEEKGHVD